MIRSMTGYGRSQQILSGREITVELRSVNHRYFEMNARIPRAYGYLEEKLKGYLQPRVGRGKLDVGVFLVNLEGTDAQVELNESLAEGYLRALRGLGQRFNLTDDLTLSVFAKMGDIFTVRHVEEDEDAVWADVRTICDEALQTFLAMRETEGARMRADVEEKLDAVDRLVTKVEERSPLRTSEYKQRLEAKMREVLEDCAFDEGRLLTEVALFSEKVAVDEETVRLRSHLSQFREILRQGGSVGRKLDFLTQEINREVNTIGSKGNDVPTARLVVDLKSEIEKIREQIQNIE